MPFRDNLREFRKKSGLSQGKLAKLSGVKTASIIKLESGERYNPSMETLIKLSRAFAITIDELTGENKRKSK